MPTNDVRSFSSLILRYSNAAQSDSNDNNLRGGGCGKQENPHLLPLHTEPTVSTSQTHSRLNSASNESSRGNSLQAGSSLSRVVQADLRLKTEDLRDKDTRPGLSQELINLVAITSSEYERYDRNVKTEKYFWTDFTIEPIETDYSRPQPENQWTTHVHPEGGLYFYNASWEIPVLTDVYVYHKNLRERLENYIHDIFQYIKKYRVDLPPEICLVLEFRLTGRCGYYFVDHKTRCLFWLDEFDAMVFLNEVRVKYTPSLVNHEMKSLYWLHNEYFPDIQPFPSDALSELRDILIHAIGDSITSSLTTAPYNLQTLEKMLRLVDNIESHDPPGIGSATIVYRFLHTFYHEKLLHLHGEQTARLNVDQSIYPQISRTLLIKTLSPLLLYGPEVHLRKLKEISADSLVRTQDWIGLLGDLTEEWKEFTLYATVLLNVNMAFLAIQSVDDSASRGRSPLQRASYFSIITSIGAIVLGLLLVRQHNFTLNRSFLAHRSASALGLETLALMYSLPYALLMWGMVSFLTAFFLMCVGSRDIPTIVMTSVSGIILFVLLVWSISVSFEKNPFWGPWPFRQLGWFMNQEGINAGRGRLKPKI